jgi:predicted acylesterase/phospholipase RssA
MMATSMSRLGQRARSYLKPDGAPTDLWDWEVWITGDVDPVRLVVYSLHPAYPSPNRIVRDSSDGFRLRIQSGRGPDDTWGTFSIRARIVRRDGGIEYAETRLDIPAANGEPVRDLLALPATPTLDDHLVLARRLKTKGAFGYAGEVLAQAERHPDYQTDVARREKVIQQKALCTYKNPLLPLDTRLAEARGILSHCRDGLGGSTDPETLGIVGAVHKRLWEVDGQRINLERAFYYYRRGYNAMLSSAGRERADYDGGAYAGVNAAFVADLLHHEERGGQADASSSARFASIASGIRADLVARLGALTHDHWWHWASLAEAHLGLAPTDPAHYARAADSLKRAMALQEVDDWERESTATQLVALLDLQSRIHGAQGAARGWAVIAELVPENRAALQRSVRGKVGLALSGGGFRASFFHIGVLARLGELDLLRHVEVLSCVSGGSIVGAHYYLELRHLLQTKTDAAVTRDDYLAIVQRLERDFRIGVQSNIRMRVAASVAASWCMLFRPRRYSRTRRIGELYESHIFRRIEDHEEGAPRCEGAPRWLNDLFVSPITQERTLEDGFSPKLHNWRRQTKVPVLVLNATTLNTGRNWQFTASSMGESASYGTGIDSTERLEPVYYGEAPEAYRGIRLGHAVAASSCVPGLFDPLVFAGLYQDRVVRLVDGGVHDNQGTRALLDQDCTVLIVSDASGQMNTDADPSNSSLGVLLRTNTVLQARVRVAQHQEVDSRRRSQLLREEMLVHLKQELESPTLRPIEGVEHPAAPAAAPPPPATSYQIRRDVQTALASIRTDLDSFTDREAYALMTSGYRTAERSLGRLPTFAGLADHRASWAFLAVEPAMRGQSGSAVDHAELLKHLRVGSKLALKVWSLHPALRWAGLGSLLLLAAGLIWAAWTWPTFPIWVNPRNLLILAGVLALGFYYKPAGRAADLVVQGINFRSTLRRMAVGLGMGTVGFLLARLHLLVFDRWFKALGRVEARPTAARPLEPL